VFVSLERGDCDELLLSQSYVGKSALWRANPRRRLVCFAGRFWQETLPHAWRGSRLRRTEGKSQRLEARVFYQRGDRAAAGDKQKVA
jgi:hypothetical protein